MCVNRVNKFVWLLIDLISINNDRKYQAAKMPEYDVLSPRASRAHRRLCKQTQKLVIERAHFSFLATTQTRFFRATHNQIGY